MRQPIYWASAGLIAIAVLLSIFAFSFSSIGAGLTNEERVELNVIATNISVQTTQSEALLNSVQPLQFAIDNTTNTININKVQDIPTLQQCQESLATFFPLLELKADAIHAGLDGINLAALDVLGPLLDTTEMMVQTLANDFGNTGQVQVLQDGTFLMSNGGNLDESVNMTYSLRQMLFPGGARLYFIQIPPNPDNLFINTTDGLGEASVVFWEWYPPLLLGGLSQTPTEDAILDGQRNKIQVTPTPVVFDQRRYDLLNGRIELVDTGRNFTAGDVVRVLRTIELNVGYL